MRRYILLLILVGLTLGVSNSIAVIVEGGTGAQNTTAPATGSAVGAPLDHVGVVNGASGVFLGTYGGQSWVLTAGHVGLGNFLLSGVTYSPVGNSSVQVRNSDNTLADLTLFRISEGPGLANLSLSSGTPASGSEVVMIGHGQNRSSSLSSWDVETSTDPWTWTGATNGTAPKASGYLSSGGNTMRWGTNTVDGNGSYALYQGGPSTTMFYTTFNAVTGEAQGSGGDSGGAVFYNSGSGWQLAGIMGVVYTYSGQPSSTAVYGNLTGIADLAAYSGFISSVIPERSTYAAIFGTGALGVALGRRRRGQRCQCR